MRLAYLVTHPIQYQAPLLKRIAKEVDISLKVFFASDLSVGNFHDVDFNTTIKWDVPLLNGYSYEFLPAIGDASRVSVLRPFSHGLRKRLHHGRFEALWVHGYARPQHWVAMMTAKRMGMKVLLRDEATLIASKRGKVKKLAKQGFFCWLDHTVDRFLTIGTLNRNYYRGYGITEERLFSVPYAVDNCRFQSCVQKAAPFREELRSALGLEPRRPILLFVGKL